MNSFEKRKFKEASSEAKNPEYLFNNKKSNSNFYDHLKQSIFNAESVDSFTFKNQKDLSEEDESITEGLFHF